MTGSMPEWYEGTALEPLDGWPRWFPPQAAAAIQLLYVGAVAVVAFRTAMWAIWFLFIPH